MGPTNTGIEMLLSALRVSAAEAGGQLPAPAPGRSDPLGADFATILESALAGVSAAQIRAAGLQDRLDRGDAVGLQDVVVELSKASLSFQMMVQVRERLVSAYREVMNMQI